MEAFEKVTADLKENFSGYYLITVKDGQANVSAEGSLVNEIEMLRTGVKALKKTMIGQMNPTMVNYLLSYITFDEQFAMGVAQAGVAQTVAPKEEEPKND